jgi:hypothetical protein
MTYSLRRTRDGAGDSGTMSLAYWLNEEDERGYSHEDNAEPRVGVSMRVGSTVGRSYSQQDWWQTTMITEILETRETDQGKYVRFKTGNSEYEWEAF